MISVQIRAEAAQRKFNRLASTLRNRVPVNKALAASMHRMVIDNFKTESHDGVPWAELAPATIAHKEKIGKQRMLQVTGQMRQSFVPFSDNDQAGVGSLNIKPHADLSKVHEEGSGSIPARPMLPSRARALEEALVVYNHFVGRAVRE